MTSSTMQAVDANAGEYGYDKLDSQSYTAQRLVRTFLNGSNHR
jgi:hypothetical protein